MEPTAIHHGSKERLLAHTLVPLVMLEIALGAAAPVAPDDVLAAVLTAMVAFTLVHVCKGRESCLEATSVLVSQLFSEAALTCMLKGEAADPRETILPPERQEYVLRSF